MWALIAIEVEQDGIHFRLGLSSNGLRGIAQNAVF